MSVKIRLARFGKHKSLFIIQLLLIQEIEEIVKEIYIRERLLAKKKRDYIKEIMRARSVKSVGDIEIDFNISKEVKRLVKLNIEELDEVQVLNYKSSYLVKGRKI